MSQGFGLRPEESAQDRAAVAAVLAQAASGNDDVLLRAQQAVGLLHSHEFLRGEAGRYWVALCAAPRRDSNPATGGL